MPLNEIAKSIESGEFSAKLNLASGMRLFMRGLEEDVAFKSLLETLKEDPESMLQILSRVEQLSRLRIDPRYENPNDVALAAYCIALNKTRPEVGRIAASFAMSSAGTWWTREIVVSILRIDINQQKVMVSGLDTKTFSDFAFELKTPEVDSGDVPLTFIRDVNKHKLAKQFVFLALFSGQPNVGTAGWGHFANPLGFRLRPKVDASLNVAVQGNWG